MTLFKLVLAVPAMLIAAIFGGDALSYGGLAGAAAFLAWFAALATARMPSGLRNLVVWSIGYSAQLARISSR